MSENENKIVRYFIISLMILIIFFVSLVFYEYYDYKLVYAENKKEYLNVYLTDKEISNLGNELKYKDQIMNFEILEISEEYVLMDDQLKRNVKIAFEHDNDYILEIYFISKNKTNIYEKLYEKYMKGMMA